MDILRLDLTEQSGVASVESVVVRILLLHTAVATPRCVMSSDCFTISWPLADRYFQVLGLLRNIDSFRPHFQFQVFHFLCLIFGINLTFIT